MQLIQIGEVRQKTVLEMIQEMADRQFAEIQKLKQSSLQRAAKRYPRRRCASSKGRR